VEVVRPLNSLCFEERSQLDADGHRAGLYHAKHV
jgi:hypothetical protein